MLALSWSRISDYRQCPHKFDLKYISKAPNFKMEDKDKSPALVRGGNIHLQCKDYVELKKINKLTGGEIWDPSVQRVIPLIDNLMEHYSIMPEKQIAVDTDFKEVSWYDKNAYFRVIYDIIGFGDVLLLGDYKTGKFADYGGTLKEMGQLHMSALIGMLLWPEFDECSSIYIFVDHKRTIPVKVDKSDVPQMRDNLVREHEAICADDVLAPKANQYCKWCEATREQCKHSKK